MPLKNEASGNPKAQVLEWCRKKTAGYRGVDLGDPTAETGGLAVWSRPWNDGLALCALLHAHFPEKIGDYDAIDVSDAAGRRDVARGRRGG